MCAGMVGIGVFGRRIGARDDQLRAGLLGQNRGSTCADEPVQRHPVRVVPEAAEEEHGQRLAPARAELVARRIDAGAQARLACESPARAGS